MIDPKKRKRKNPNLVSLSLCWKSRNFLKSEEEAKLAAEADKEVAKEEEEHVTRKKRSKKKHEEKNEIASSENKTSPKAIEFASYCYRTRRGELNRLIGAKHEREH